MLNFLPSKRFLKTLVFLGLLGLIGLIFSQHIDLTVTDLGRHIANGRAVWSNPDILFHNAYSYTEPDFPFINHHWLYGVIVYSVYSLTGFVGLSILNIVIILAAFSAAFFITRKKLGGISLDLFGREKFDGFYATSLLSLPVILLLSERVEIRPEIFSYLFIILTYALLDAVEMNKKYRRLWLLIPLFIIWANIHIYFFIGLALVGFKAAAVLIKALMEKKGSVWKTARPWLMVFGAAAIACLLNPNTWRGLAYPFNIFRNYGYEVAENKSVFFLEHLMVNDNFCLFKFLLVLLLISWALYFFVLRQDWRARLGERLFDILASIFIISLALFASRNIALFGLFSLIIMGANFAPVLQRLRERNEARLSFWGRFICPLFPRLHRYILFGLLALIIITFFFLMNDARRDGDLIKNQFGLGLYENNEAAAGFFKAKNLQGPIFNNYDSGSALIFWLYGQEKVFVDNRPEAYSNAFFNDIYRPMQTDAVKWQEYSQQYGFKTIFFSYTDSTPWAQQFLARILQEQEWRLVYFDAYTVILIDPAKYSPEEVGALSFDKWAFKTRLRELSADASLKHKFHLANLAQLAGIPESAAEIYRDILFAYPDQAQALYALAGLYAGYGSREDMNTAVNYYQRTLDAGLRLPGVYNSLGLAYWNLGEYEKAADAWRAALKRERKNTHALYYLDQMEQLRLSGELPVN